VWAGVDNVLEQEKLEATIRKMLETTARCPMGGNLTRQIHVLLGSSF